MIHYLPENIRLNVVFTVVAVHTMEETSTYTVEEEVVVVKKEEEDAKKVDVKAADAEAEAVIMASMNPTTLTRALLLQAVAAHMAEAQAVAQ